MSETIKSGTEREARTVTINVPASADLLGLGTVISWLLVAAAWGVVGIAYLCVPGSVVAAALGVASAAMNLGGGLAAFALAAGVAVTCIGLCMPCLAGANALRCLLLRRPVELSASVKRLLAVSAVVLLVGCAIAGVAVLAGGGDALVVPGFLQGVIG